MTISSSHLQFQFTHGQPDRPQRRETDAPLRILVIGDFGARSTREVTEPLAGRRIDRVDVDALEDFFSRRDASLSLPAAGEPDGRVKLRFASLEDFHPDALLKSVPSLAELLQVRKNLESSKAAAAADRLQALLNVDMPPGQLQQPPSTAPTVNESSAAGESTHETLARLLGKPPEGGPAPQPAPEAAAGFDAQSIIKRILATPGKSAPPPPPGLPGLISAAESALAERLRSLLSHPEWQALETTWRGLDFLVRRCPDEDRVHYFVLDASLAELAADLDGLHRLLRDHAWGVMVPVFIFGRSTADLGTLAGLGAVARSLGTRVLAGADSRLVGCDCFGEHPDPDDWTCLPAADVDQAWHELRSNDVAPFIALAMPRFLLRQPYGRSGDPIERFAFEEIIDTSGHEHFCWGNSALLAAQLIAEGHAAGERINAGNLGNLQPAHYVEHGGTAIKPCAEAWLVDRAIETITRKGFIAIQSFKGRDAAQITGLHAIGHPEKPSRIID